ncbi:MAG: N-(5'-phosphoribosyl)anthranilate isomerase [Gammaproteobacteria bacterium]|nr:MAG: N-(5'-phosphoribosyl)anthranilate isomerase [Gammaproteobacteria bacterium]
MSRVRIKICGITRPRDGLEAGRLGVDAVGLVFHPPSPRCVDIAVAAAVAAALPPFVSVVGLFMNADPERVRMVIGAVPLDCLQFHGDEPPEYCASFGRPYIKAVPMMDEPDLRKYAERYGTAAGFLLDAVRQGEPGGRGQTFDWSRVPRDLGRPLILAGGLTPENVAEAVRVAGCYAVDVSSGVEEDKGIKSVERMRAFVEAVESVR